MTPVWPWRTCPRSNWNTPLDSTYMTCYLMRQSHWGYDWCATTYNLLILGGLRWSLKGHRPSYDGHCRFWWSLGVSATLLQPFGHREVFGACSKFLSTTKWSQTGPMQSAAGRRLVSNCRTMVFCGRRKVFVFFSSRRPLVSATGRRPTRQPPK